MTDAQTHNHELALIRTSSTQFDITIWSVNQWRVRVVARLVGLAGENGCWEKGVGGMEQIRGRVCLDISPLREWDRRSCEKWQDGRKRYVGGGCRWQWKGMMGCTEKGAGRTVGGSIPVMDDRQRKWSCKAACFTPYCNMLTLPHNGRKTTQYNVVNTALCACMPHFPFQYASVCSYIWLAHILLFEVFRFNLIKGFFENLFGATKCVGIFNYSNWQKHHCCRVVWKRF